MTENPVSRYYPAPYSYSPLPAHVDAGLLVIGSLACFSLFVTTTVLAFIAHRFILWYQSGHRTCYNQCVVLVFNLLLADFYQALAFAISFHWHHLNGIMAPTSYCWAQGAMLNFGNIASGSFVFLIALHTCFIVFKRREADVKWFTGIILGIWSLAIVLSIVGPLTFGAHFYTRAGNWCWISQKYELTRLLLHYLWIFIFEFGTICIYAGLFFYIHRTTKEAGASSSLPSSNSKVTKAARYMILYPIIYLVGTLPIAIGRMLTLAGHSLPDRYFIFAGSMLTCCGWLDGLIYAFTRKVFLKADSAGHRYSRSWRRGNSHKASVDSTNTAKRDTSNTDPDVSATNISIFDHSNLNRMDSATFSPPVLKSQLAIPIWEGQSIAEACRGNVCGERSQSVTVMSRLSFDASLSPITLSPSNVSPGEKENWKLER